MLSNAIVAESAVVICLLQIAPNLPGHLKKIYFSGLNFVITGALLLHFIVVLYYGKLIFPVPGMTFHIGHRQSVLNPHRTDRQTDGQTCLARAFHWHLSPGSIRE